MNLSHSETYRVRRYEVGPDQRLTVTQLCNYLEDAAGAHAEVLRVGQDDMAAKGLAWVLARLRLVVERMPGEGDEVRVHTRPVSIERLQFRRDFTVYVDEAPVARAVNQWVIMNLATRRLERMPADFSALTPEHPDFALEDADIRPGDPAAGLPGPTFPVRLDDIDRNRHVNNVRFAGFALEAARLTAGEEKTLRRLDLVFKAEGRFGDVILTRTSRNGTGPDILLHGLYREQDGRELVRAETEWV